MCPHSLRHLPLMSSLPSCPHSPAADVFVDTSVAHWFAVTPLTNFDSLSPRYLVSHTCADVFVDTTVAHWFAVSSGSLASYSVFTGMLGEGRLCLHAVVACRPAEQYLTNAASPVA